MGKNLIQQRRGKGSPRFKARSFAYIGDVRYPKYEGTAEGRVIDLVHSSGHSAPIAKVIFGREEALLIAPIGMKVGDSIKIGAEADVKDGNILPVEKIPEGTSVYNLESKPKDGGKFVRSSGTSARVLAKSPAGVLVQLPSKKQRLFNNNCMATIGIISGFARVEKPMLKAGNMHYKKKARNKFYPRVSALSMNAVSHPFGGSRSSKLGKSQIAPRFAPPGRKVGLIRPRRTGKRK